MVFYVQGIKEKEQFLLVKDKEQKDIKILTE